MKKLKKILDAWCDGLKYKGVKTPPLATIYELIDIYNGVSKTTINSEVVSILSFCGIKYRVKGIGWEVLR